MPPTPTAQAQAHLQVAPLLPSLFPRQAPVPSRVNLGPLTTAFAFPSHCSRIAISGTNAIRGQTCRFKPTATAEDDTGCWPRATMYPTAAASASSLAGLGFYSPGYVCPGGYHTVCSQVSATGNAAAQVTGATLPNFAFQFPLVAGETALGCCPSGYSAKMQNGAQSCHQVATNTALDIMTCNGAEIMDVNSFQVQTVEIWAPLIQINHMTTDLPVTSYSMNNSSMLVTSTPTATVRDSGKITTRSATSGASGGVPRSSTVSGSEISKASATISGISTPISSTTFSESVSGSSFSSSERILGNVIATPSSSVSGSASISSNGNPSGSSVSFTSATGIASGSASSLGGPKSSATASSFSTKTGIVANIIATLPGVTTAIMSMPTMTSIMTHPSSTTTAPATPKHSDAAKGIQSSSNPDPQPGMPATAKVGIAFVPIAAAVMIITWALYRYHKNHEKKPELEEPISKVPEMSAPVITSPYNDDAEQASGAPVGPNGLSIDDAAAFATRRNTDTDRYNGMNPRYVNSKMLDNGPGPAVHNSVMMVPYGYAHDPAVRRADDMTEKLPMMHCYGDERYMLTPAPAHFRNVSIGTDVESVDSPIDGTSPFRLKRGDSKTKQAAEDASPLAPSVSTSSSTAHSSPSHEGSEWEYNGLKRENSFSRPRPSRPKTGASSIYTDGDRDTRVLSWNDGDSPMPPMPGRAVMATVIENEHEVRFSKPFMPPRKESVDAAVVAIAAGKITPPPVAAGDRRVTPPPVTDNGVAF